MSGDGDAGRLLGLLADRLPPIEAALHSVAARSTPARREALLGERATLEGTRRRLRALARGLDLPTPGRPAVTWEGLTVDAEHHRVTWRGEPVALTRQQVLVVYELAAAGGGLVSREAMTRALYGPGEVRGRACEAFVCRTRQRLSAAGVGVTIGTTWGAGWSLVTRNRKAVGV